MTEDKRTWHVALRNGGSQDVRDVEVRARIAKAGVINVVIPQLRSETTAEVSFALPTAFTAREAQVTLSAVKLVHPMREWLFPAQSVTLPRPAWFVYALTAGVVMLAGAIGWYFWRRLRVG
jgi:hypothetical protein